MKQHKWHKEIKAWADGAEIQIQSKTDGTWIDCIDGLLTFSKDFEYRIKPQPKEPQYLYVYLDDRYEFSPIKIDNPLWQYIGKIKIEDETSSLESSS